jgi:hypothetical protein
MRRTAVAHAEVHPHRPPTLPCVACHAAEPTPGGTCRAAPRATALPHGSVRCCCSCAERALEKFLPSDAHVRCGSRLRVLLTKARTAAAAYSQAARLDERIGRIAEKARLCLRSNPGDDGVAVLHGRSAAGGWSAFPMRASCATRPPLGPPQRRAVRAVSQCSRAVARVARLMPRPSDRRHPAVQRQRWSAPPTSLTALRLAGLRRPRSGARASF